MPLNLFYTMVQKSQKWPKTQIKGGPALNIQPPPPSCYNSRLLKKSQLHETLYWEQERHPIVTWKGE